MKPREISILSFILRLRHLMKDFSKSLGYGEAHPEVVSGFILAGIYLASTENNSQIWYGMRENYPEEWEEMVAFIPAEEHADLITAYHKRLMNPDPKVHMPAARAFVK